MRFDRLTVRAQEAIQEAQQEAVNRQHQSIDIEHLLYAMIKPEDGTARNILQKVGASIPKILDALNEDLAKRPTVTGATATYGASMSSRLQQSFNEAFTIADKMGDDYISSEHILLAAAKDPLIGRIFKPNGVDEDDLLTGIEAIRGSSRVDDPNAESRYQALEKYGIDLTERARQGKLDPVIGRDEEIRRVVQVLSRRTKNNPVLIGEPGVGKTAVVEGLAMRIVKGDVPESLSSKRVVSLDIGSMVAGAKSRGEFEDRLKSVLDEIKKSDGQIILFIDELHTLVGAGKAEGSLDAANMLKPMLARGELRCVGATTLNEYRQYIEKDKALERRFQTVIVNQPSVEETISILRGLKERYEIHHGVRITDSAIIAAATLSDRYITDRFLPDKAIDLVDEAASRLKIEIDSVPAEIDELQRQIQQHEIDREALKKETDQASKQRLEDTERRLADINEQLNSRKAVWMREKEQIESIRTAKEELEKMGAELEIAQRDADWQRASQIQYGEIPAAEKRLNEALEKAEGTSLLKEAVDSEDIAEVVSKWTGVPVSKLMQGEMSKLLTMEDVIAGRVVGQSEPISILSDAIRRARSGIADPNRPIGSFLFLGPTGVGKTETAKALAEFLFNDERAIVRIDMSEYQDKHTVSRLIGAPPGYVGYEEGGQLTEVVRRMPYCVILLDEVEKAHPEVFNVLLQVLDDGRLTDGQGRTVNFKNTVIIMTSNLGAHYFGDGLLSQDEFKEVRERVLGEVRAHFRPEFLNRLDDILIFKPLGASEVKAIALIQIQQLERRLGGRNVSIQIDDAAMSHLAAVGFDPVYGARPLRRAIEREVLNPLSKMILSGEVKDGDSISVGLENGQMSFKLQRAAEPVK